MFLWLAEPIDLRFLHGRLAKGGFISIQLYNVVIIFAWYREVILL